MEKVILDLKDIINTYPKKNQEFAHIYLKYLKLKQQHPSLGYKRLSRLLKEPMHRTRYWHHSNAIPQPILTSRYLREKGLLPLNLSNKNLLVITKILGTIFGDGGIFQNLNAIFLSSSELEAVKEFGKDLKIIFGKEIELNSRIIEGGEYGHSWCYQNTNRNVVRFFQALGAPIGKKSVIELKIPVWVFSKEDIAAEFFGSLFGNEINIPKVHIGGTHLDTLSIGFTGTSELKENRINFLMKVKDYLEGNGINTGSICQSKNKGREDSIIYKLLISTKIENVINFKERTKLNYCIYKKEKLEKTINEFIKIKKQRLSDLKLMGYTEDGAMNLLKIDKGLFGKQ